MLSVSMSAAYQTNKCVGRKPSSLPGSWITRGGSDVLKILHILRLTCSWQGKLHSVSMKSLPGFVKKEQVQISPSLLPLLGPCQAPASFGVVKMESVGDQKGAELLLQGLSDTSAFPYGLKGGGQGSRACKISMTQPKKSFICSKLGI